MRRSRMGSRKAFMDSTRSFLQSSATSDSCVNVKKQRGRMPPAAKGLSPFGNPLGENNDACWRAASRASRRHCFPVSRGLSPPAARGIFLPSLKDKVQLFLERIRFREARARALALPASSMSQTSLGSLSRPCAGREWVRGRRSWIRRGAFCSRRRQATVA